MINDPLSHWRETLYFLGFIAQSCFAIRFITQWLLSERKGESTVSPLFWKTSLFGSLLLSIHSIIQLQFSPCLIQSINAVIAYRNLNLEQPPQKRFSLRTLVILFIGAALLSALAFILQGYFLLDGHTIWARTPISFINSAAREQSLSWDFLGFIGCSLFASRFWVQCYLSEVKQKSYVGASFWWLSLMGALLMILYFVRLRDLVNLIGPLVGIPPYIRNLMLMRKTKPDLLHES